MFAALIVGLTAGCNGKGDDSACAECDSDADTDADTDSDTDSDTDADTDSDTDTDTDVCDFEACEGDATGSWTFESACLDFWWVRDSVKALCAMGTVDTTQVATGTLDLEKGGTYAIDLSEDITIDITYPAECNAHVTSCEEWDGGSVYTCTGDVAKACVCTTSLTYPHVDSGTWSQKGKELTFDPAGKTTEIPSGRICARADSLEIESQAAFMLHGVLKLRR